jgi:hypothetical protein
MARWVPITVVHDLAYVRSSNRRVASRALGRAPAWTDSRHTPRH